MKTILSLTILCLTFQAQSALWSFKVFTDGLLSNGVPWGVTNALAPVFSPTSGAVPQLVEITSAGNLIYWTTNGDTPSTNLAGIPSGQSVLVTSTNHPLKALAWFADGYRLPSTVTEAYYTNAVTACSPWVSQTNGSDYYDAANTYTFAQKIRVTNETTITVCAVRLRSWTPVDGALTVSFWSTANGTGTQYGSTSGSQTVSTAGVSVYTTNEFTFASAPVLTGDAFMVITATTDSPRIWADVSGGAAYQDTDYAIYRGGTVLAAGAADFWFEIDSNQ
jgi:hypothetical protein